MAVLLAWPDAPLLAVQTSHKVRAVAHPLRSVRKPARHQPANTRPSTPPAPAIDPAQAQALAQESALQRQQLHDKLDALRRDIAAAEASRSEAVDALAGSERAISNANSKLHDLTSQQLTLQTDLSSIAQRSSSLQGSMAQQQKQLASLLHQQYLAGAQDPFKLMFSGDDPNRIQRDLYYLGYVSKAQANLMSNLRDNLARLNGLEEEKRKRNEELSDIASAMDAERADLVRVQQTRQQTLAEISEKLRLQQKAAGALENDEKRLGQVVTQLTQVIERQARETRAREAERAEREKTERDRAEKDRAERDKAEHERQQASKAAADRNAANAGNAATPAANPPPAATASAPLIATAPMQPPPRAPASTVLPDSSREHVSEPDPPHGSFAKLRGRLHLPVRGDLAERFGNVRPDGGPSWKGLFIRASSGSEVKAVAPGRVVFAEWLRGFGNLLIVDHGDQYLSIYGNNESLFKHLGDSVHAGDVLASVGNSGGNPETGLYFELRYQGRPFDPLSWAGARNSP